MVEEIILGERNLYGNKGQEIAMVGCQGCGKTHGLAKIALNRLDLPQTKKNIVIWRGSKDCQWSYFLNQDEHDVVFWIKEGLDFEVINRDKEKVVDIEDFGEVNYWSSHKKLVNDHIRNDKINVIYAYPKQNKLKFVSDWKSIFTQLNERLYKRYVTVLFDEFADLVPAYPEGEVWKRVVGSNDNEEEGMDEIIRAARKNRIFYFFVIHNWTDIHHTVSKKIRTKIWMRASHPNNASNANSIIRSDMTELEDGEGWIETDDRKSYDGFKFNPFIGDEKNLRLRDIKTPEGGG